MPGAFLRLKPNTSEQLIFIFNNYLEHAVLSLSRAQCRLRSVLVHPDKFSSRIAETAFRQLSQAYEHVLQLIAAGTEWAIVAPHSRCMLLSVTGYALSRQCEDQAATLAWDCRWPHY